MDLRFFRRCERNRCHWVPYLNLQRGGWQHGQHWEDDIYVYNWREQRDQRTTWRNPADTLTNLANAVNGNGSDTSVHASASGNTLSLTSTSTGVAANGLAANGNILPPGSIGTGTWSTAGSPGNLGGGTGGANAQGLLSLLNIANLSSGAQVSIGNVVYTFQTAAPTQAGQVQIASTGLQTFQNLAAAINGTGLNSQNPSVTAGNAYVWLEEDNGTTYDLIQLTALNPGQSGNSIQESSNALFNSSGAWTYGFSGGVKNRCHWVPYLNLQRGGWQHGQHWEDDIYVYNWREQRDQRTTWRNRSRHLDQPRQRREWQRQ